MSNKKKFTILTILTLCLCLMLSACAKTPTDLEGYIKSNEEVKSQIESEAVGKGMKIEVKGNTVSYVYDLANADGINEESIMDPVVQEGLAKALGEGKAQFVSTCKELEETTGLTGISITVTFEYNGEQIASQTYSSAD